MKSPISFRRTAFALLALFAVTARVSAADDLAGEHQALALLMSTKKAAGELSFKGMISYAHANRVDSLMVVHGVFDGVERERLLSVNTPMREVVRDAEKVTCYLPDKQSMTVEHKRASKSLLFDIPADLSESSRHYRFELGPSEHVAQRSAKLVLIEPRDEFRYARRLWVDESTKLPLKAQLLDETQQVVEEMSFNMVTIGEPIAASELEPTTKVSQGWQTKDQETLPADSLDWSFEGVPDGFRIVSYTRLKRGTDNRSIDHILLSDGFSSVSIYMDQFMKDIFTGQPRKLGGVHSFSRQIEGYLVTVMGEVPEKTVASIANGIRKQPDGASR